MCMYSGSHGFQRCSTLHAHVHVHVNIPYIPKILTLVPLYLLITYMCSVTCTCAGIYVPVVTMYPQVCSLLLSLFILQGLQLFPQTVPLLQPQQGGVIMKSKQHQPRRYPPHTTSHRFHTTAFCKLLVPGTCRWTDYVPKTHQERCCYVNYTLNLWFISLDNHLAQGSTLTEYFSSPRTQSHS